MDTETIVIGSKLADPFRVWADQTAETLSQLEVYMTGTDATLKDICAGFFNLRNMPHGRYPEPKAIRERRQICSILYMALYGHQGGCLYKDNYSLKLTLEVWKNWRDSVAYLSINDDSKKEEYAIACREYDELRYVYDNYEVKTNT